MALCKRLIARLDIKGSRLIKGIRFEGLRVLGDPREAALRYAEAGADELLYVDAVASLYGRNGLADLLRRTSSEVFIPITAGGGVRSVEDAAALLAAGADKIAVNTSALHRPQLLTELAETFGKQCVVVSIQARRTGPNSWEAMAESGRERSGRDVLDWLQHAQDLGAGEILLTSVDQDGTCGGPDDQLLLAAGAKSKVPLVVGGGFASSDQVLQALRSTTISAVSLGAALHRGKLDILNIKQELLSSPPKLSLRFSLSAGDILAFVCSKPLAGMCVGVVDYGMGNQHSLMNALKMLGASPHLSSHPDSLQHSDLLALPGVGAFPKGMAELKQRGLDRWLKQWVSEGGGLLGICLGMQMLFESGEEFVHTPGLSLLEGKVLPLPSCDQNGERLTLPHIGWNRLLPGSAWKQSVNFDPLIQYFVHSYAVTHVNPRYVLFSCLYGDHQFVAAVSKQKVLGFQFHPERSGPEGLALLADACLSILR